jgi:hypothetical protein
MRTKAFYAILSAASLALALSGCGGSEEGVPDGKGGGVKDGTVLQSEHETLDHNQGNGNAGHGHGGGGTGISYHGGPVMVSGVNVHYIYYGNFSADKNVLENLARNIGGSPYFNINTTYYNGSNTHVPNSVSFAGAVTDSGSHGTALTDANIQQIVAAQNPTDTNGVYFVLTAPNVSEGGNGFCGNYCGWHTHATINGRDIKYAFIGDPTRCPSSCEEQSVGPNGSSGADGMASIISHELEEATTDPDLNAWYDQRGAENADKCAWTFGSTYTSGGAVANMNLGGKDYLIQQNWVNAGSGGCAKSY